MEQLSFFAEAGQSKGLPKELLGYRPGLFDQAESDYLLQKFITEAPWKQTDSPDLSYFLRFIKFTVTK
jgi:hypothetical protein